MEDAQKLAADAAAAAEKLRKERQQKRATEARRNSTPPQTAAEATLQMLAKKRLDSKINYAVLNELFEESKGFWNHCGRLINTSNLFLCSCLAKDYLSRPQRQLQLGGMHFIQVKGTIHYLKSYENQNNIVVYARRFGITEMAGTGYAVMGVMFGYMLSVPKYLASYSRIWRKRIITAQNAKQCLTMSHHLHKSGNQKSGL